MDTLIQIQDLTKRFGSLAAVDGISFSVDRGEVLGFLGPNGAGKSTTMKMVTGFLAPTSGTIRVAGRDVATDAIGVQTRIGYLPEGAPLYPDMHADGLLRFVAEIRGLTGSTGNDRIAEVVDKVHLEGVLHQPIETLSKGYKRRVGLALSILHDPEVLILDEPTDGLDPNQKQEVRDLIREMASDKAIVLSTHILEEVEALCTRAVIIDRGRIVSDGTPAELEACSPHHNAVRLKLFGEPDGVRATLAGLKGVATVEEGPRANGTSSWTVLPRDGARIAHDVSDACRGKGWEIGELFVERGRLDDVFRSLTKGDIDVPATLQPSARGKQASEVTRTEKEVEA
jgi:ABC-2 type transport system ATP-binding protein